MGRKKRLELSLWRWKRLKGNANLGGFGSGEAGTGRGGGGGGGAVFGWGEKAVGEGGDTGERGVVNVSRNLNTLVDPNGKLDFSPSAFHFDWKGCKKKRMWCWSSDGRVRERKGCIWMGVSIGRRRGK